MNLYQTSADVLGLALQVAAKDGAVGVAPTNVPEMGVQVGPELSKVAEAAPQLLFAGCASKLCFKNKKDNRKSVKTLVEFFIQNWILPKVLLLLFFLQA